MTLEALFAGVKEGDVGLFGDPVAHSLSPAMQNAAFQLWRGAFVDREKPAPHYHKFHVPAPRLKESLLLAKERGLLGLNITVPHKVAVFDLLDEWDAFASDVKSVNTLVFKDGKIVGANTDGEGFKRAIEWDMELDLTGKRVLLLGVGGTGRVILRQLMAMHCADIAVWNRSLNRLADIGVLAKNEIASSLRILKNDQDALEASTQADLIINATSVGLLPTDPVPVRGLCFRPGQAVFDVIYHRKTAFLAEAQRMGARIQTGEGMFVYQGAMAFELWTGCPAPLDVMRHVVQNAIKGNDQP